MLWGEKKSRPDRGRDGVRLFGASEPFYSVDERSDAVVPETAAEVATDYDRDGSIIAVPRSDSGDAEYFRSREIELIARDHLLDLADAAGEVARSKSDPEPIQFRDRNLGKFATRERHMRNRRVRQCVSP